MRAYSEKSVDSLSANKYISSIKKNVRAVTQERRTFGISKD